MAIKEKSRKAKQAEELKKEEKSRVEEVNEETSQEEQSNNQIQMNPQEIITWDDEKCVSSGITVPLIQVRNILRELASFKANYDVLRTTLLTGAMVSYSVECPQCHKIDEVTPQELKREENVTCPECNCSYSQTMCIKGINTFEKDKENV